MSPAPDSGISRRILVDLEDAGYRLRDIARWLGCDESQLSHYRSGARAMKAWELERLVARVGAPVALRELAAGGDCDVVPRSAPAAEPLSKGIELSAQMTGLTATISAAQADGRIDADELADLERRHAEVAAGLAELRAGLRLRAVPR